MQPGQNVYPVGYLGGATVAVDVQGDTAYIGVGREFTVLDISTPAAPHEVGALDTPGLASGVAVAGGTAYVADGSAGLRYAALGIFIVGTHAYVADGAGGLRVLDVSNPAAPREAGYFQTYAAGAYVAGDYTYIAGENSGLSILRYFSKWPVSINLPLILRNRF